MGMIVATVEDAVVEKHETHFKLSLLGGGAPGGKSWQGDEVFSAGTSLQVVLKKAEETILNENFHRGEMVFTVTKIENALFYLKDLHGVMQSYAPMALELVDLDSLPWFKEAWTNCTKSSVTIAEAKLMACFNSFSSNPLKLRNKIKEQMKKVSDSMFEIGALLDPAIQSEVNKAIDMKKK